MIKRNRAIDCCIQTATPFLSASLHATETGISSGLVSHTVRMRHLCLLRIRLLWLYPLPVVFKSHETSENATVRQVIEKIYQAPLESHGGREGKRECGHTPLFLYSFIALCPGNYDRLSVALFRDG